MSLPLKRFGHGFLVFQFVLGECLLPFAHAQQARPTYTGQEIAPSVLARLVGGVQALELNPSYNVARNEVLPRSLQEIRALESRSLRADERAALLNYKLTFHNRVMNAMAVANQVADVTHDAELRNIVFSSIIDVVPEVEYESSPSNQTMSLFLLPSGAGSEINGEHVGARLRDVQRAQRGVSDSVQSRAQYSMQAFRRRLVHENEKALLKSYWLYRGLYERNLPSSNVEGLRDLIGDVRIHDPRYIQNLADAVGEVREYIAREVQLGRANSGESGRRRNLQSLVRRLNEARQQLRRLRRRAPRQLAGPEQFGSLSTEAWQAWTAIQWAKSSLDTFPRLDPRISRGSAVINGVIGDLQPYLASMVGKDTTSRRCRPDGHLTLDTRGHYAVRNFFEQVQPGHGQALLNEFLSHLYRVRPEPALRAEDGDGCVAGGAPYGFQSRKYFFDFVEALYSRLYADGAGMLPPWELDGSANYQRARARFISEEPLLSTEAIKDSYEGDTTFTITAAHVRRALEEQREAIQDNLSELSGFLRSTDYREDVATLLERNPVAVWRLVASDWRYLVPMADAYGRVAERRREGPSPVYIWAGVAIAAIAVSATLAPPLLGLSGPWAVGVVFTGTVLGFIGTVTHFTPQVMEAYRAHHEYRRMVNQLMAGVGSSVLSEIRMKQQLERFHSAMIQATISGAFAFADIAVMMSALRLARQVAVTRAALVRSGPAGAIISQTEIDGGRLFGSRFSVLSRGEQRANLQALELNRLLREHAGQTSEQWLAEISRRASSRSLSLEELVAWGMHHFDDAVFAQPVREALARGATISVRAPLASRIGVMLRYGAADGAERMGALSRLMGEMGYNSMRAAHPSMATVAEAERVFGHLFERILRAGMPAETWAFDGISEIIRRGFEGSLRASDLNRGAVIRAFIDALFSEAEHPLVIQMRARRYAAALLEAQVAPPVRYQLIEDLSQGVTSRGGFWGFMREKLARAGGQALMQQYAREFRVLWIGFWSASFLALDYEAYAHVHEWIFAPRVQDPRYPEGVNALLVSAARAARSDVSVIEGQIREAEGRLALYQEAQHRLHLNQEQRERCLGRLLPAFEMCSTEEGRRNSLRLLEENDEDFRNAMSRIEAVTPQGLGPAEYVAHLRDLLRGREIEENGR